MQAYHHALPPAHWDKCHPREGRHFSRARAAGAKQAPRRPSSSRSSSGSGRPTPRPNGLIGWKPRDQRPNVVDAEPGLLHLPHKLAQRAAHGAQAYPCSREALYRPKNKRGLRAPSAAGDSPRPGVLTGPARAFQLDRCTSSHAGALRCRAKPKRQRQLRPDARNQLGAAPR